MDAIVIVSGIIGTLVTGFTAWFFGRKKTAAEVMSLQIDNDVKLSKHYRDLLDDLKARYVAELEKFREIAAMETRLREQEIKFLKKKIQILQQENRELRAEVKRLTQQNNNLISAAGNGVNNTK